MKTIILTIGFIIGLNFTFLSQNIKLTESELGPILCKQWEVEYAMMGTMKITQKIGAADFDFKFKSDGKYNLIREDGNNDIGIWTYNSEKKYVELSIKGKITSRIKSIDKDKLILTLVSGQNDPTGLPSIEVHFKPI